MKKLDGFIERLKVIGRSPRPDEMDEIMKELKK